MAEQFSKGGQQAWFHDQGHWGGFFHTYDRFQANLFELDDHFKQPRKLHVFIPRDYEFSQTHYPVIYANDGDNLFFADESGQSWNFAQTISRLYLQNQIQKVIVVGICSGDHSVARVHDRDYEYTHAPVWEKRWGGLNDYSRYVAKAIKPFIDGNYRTNSNPDQTLIFGADLGGLAAFYTAMQYPETFGLVAALSPSFWVGLESNLERSRQDLGFSLGGSLEHSALIFASTRTLENRENRPKIYLDWGTLNEGDELEILAEEWAKIRGREMRKLLTGQFGYRENIDLFTLEDLIGRHCIESWAGRMEMVLKMFF